MFSFNHLLLCLFDLSNNSGDHSTYSEIFSCGGTDRLSLKCERRWEKQLVTPCDYLVFTGNSGYAEQVLTGNMCLVMQMYRPMIAKHTMQRPLWRAKKEKKKKHAIKGATWARFWCAFGIKVHTTRIYHILIEQSHQTTVWWLHESLCDSVCEAYH